MFVPTWAGNMLFILITIWAEKTNISSWERRWKSHRGRLELCSLQHDTSAREWKKAGLFFVWRRGECVLPASYCRAAIRQNQDRQIRHMHASKRCMRTCVHPFPSFPCTCWLSLIQCHVPGKPRLWTSSFPVCYLLGGQWVAVSLFTPNCFSRCFFGKKSPTPLNASLPLPPHLSLSRWKWFFLCV